MIPIALLPLAVGCFVFGVALTWPVAHRAGRTSANTAADRDREEISRILGGLDAPAILDDTADLPAQYGTIAEHHRRQELVRHAAPVPDIDWHRGEHRLFSWRWVVEVLARLASIGAKPNVPLVVAEYTPRHTDEWLVSTQEIAKVVEEETRRRDDEFEALLYSLVAKGAVLR